MGTNKSSLTPLPVILKEIQRFNPFASGDFGEKTRFEASQAVF